MPYIGLLVGVDPIKINKVSIYQFARQVEHLIYAVEQQAGRAVTSNDTWLLYHTCIKMRQLLFYLLLKVAVYSLLVSGVKLDWTGY